MKILKIEGKTREDNRQYIIIDKKDKYGVGMLAYFKNSLNGQNVKRLAITNKKDVQFFNDRINGQYILQISKFSIAEESIISNYNNFKKKYDILIKDKISHL